MTEEKKSLLQRLTDLLFGRAKADRADQNERRDDMSGFMKDHARNTEKALADQDERFGASDKPA